jgi:O-antigen/teichoic acid export membrane protein
MVWAGSTAGLRRYAETPLAGGQDTKTVLPALEAESPAERGDRNSRRPPASIPRVLPEASAAARARHLLLRLRRDPFLRNNAIYFLGSVGAGILGYAYHFSTGRLLGPAGYSVVASAVAALYLLSLPAPVILTVSMRFTSVAAAQERLGDIRPLLARISAISLVIGGAIALVLVAEASTVARYLQLSDVGVVYLLAPATLLGLLLATTRGAIQGLRRFAALSGNLVLDIGVRVVVAVALIFAKLGASGAVLGLVAGPALAYVQSFLLLRSVKRGDVTETTSLSEVGRYAIRATVGLIGITYLFNADVVLAKHYLAPAAAGIYAAGSVLGRVIYFLGVSIAGVMFPEVASLHARDEGHFHVVDMSLLFLGALAIAFTGFYVLVPQLVLIPYGSSFAPVTPFLGTFALGLSLLALSNLLVTYFLSVNNSRFMVPLIAACVLETVLISAFHADPGQVARMLVLTVAALSVVLGLMYGFDRFRLGRLWALQP